MTVLTASQRQILEDIASRKTTGWQEAPDVFGDHQMLYEACLIDGVSASADDGFGLLDMRLTMAGQQALAVPTIRASVVREEPKVEVVRPVRIRWSYWGKIAVAGVVAVGGCITFVIGVWTFYVDILSK